MNNYIAKSIIFFVACTALNASLAATIRVNTSNMDIDVSGRQFITEDPDGRSGLYKPNSFTISDLNNADKNPADAQSGDDPAISLPEAIIAANNTTGADIILLGVNKTYTLNSINNHWYGPNALPPITSSISIQSAPDEDQILLKTDKAAIIERDSAAPNMRLFFVMGNLYSGNNSGKQTIGVGKLTLNGVTIRNGYAQGGSGSGGGAGLGGAIFNQGSLSIQNTTLSNNTAEGGSGLATDNIGGGGPGGDGAANKGGGFLNTAFIGDEDSAPFESIFGGNGGNSGSGGLGPSNDNGVNGGGLKATDSTRTDKLPAFGAGGGLPAHASGENGNSGAFGSGGGYGLVGGAGGFGGGGGRSTGGTASTAGYAAGAGDSSSGGGGAGLGGAIFNHLGVASVVNSTLSGNSTIGGSGATGGSAYGAAIFSINGSVQLSQSTLYNNSSSAPSGGVADSQALYITAQTGPGVRDGLISLTSIISNSILGNSGDVSSPMARFTQGGSDAQNRISFAGKNIVFPSLDNDDAVEVLNKTSKVIYSQPFPDDGPLQDNGGPTQTILPTTGSPAIDAGDNKVNALSYDQRLVARVKDFGDDDDSAIIDIGASEAGNNLAAEITLADSLEIEDSRPVIVSSLIDFQDPDNPVSLASKLTSENQKAQLTISATNASFTVAKGVVEALEKQGVVFSTDKQDDGSIQGNEVIAQGSITALRGTSVFNLGALGIRVVRGLLSLTTLTPEPGLGADASDSITLSLEVDDMGNTGDGPEQISSKSKDIAIKGVKPTVTVSSTIEVTDDRAFEVVFRFSEAVKGFSKSDIVVENGSLISGLISVVDDQVYKVRVRSGGEGKIYLSVPANSVTDGIGLSNTASNTLVVISDTSPPNIEIDGLPSVINNADPFTITIKFDEGVTGFTENDIVLSNASISEFSARGKQYYSATIAPYGHSGIRLSIKKNIAHDDVGNGNNALPEVLIPLRQGGDDSGGSGAFSFYSLLLAFLLLGYSRKYHLRCADQ